MKSLMSLKITRRAYIKCAGGITFRDVCFAYNGDYPVLSDISFAIKPGTRVGIMGMTGGGKSTLVSLLTRFHDPTRGQILLDGVDLRDYRLTDLRNQFGIVLQESILFSTSIERTLPMHAPARRNMKSLRPQRPPTRMSS